MMVLVLLIYPVIVIAAANTVTGVYSGAIARLGAAMSYPLYLVHVPIFSLVLPRLPFLRTNPAGRSGLGPPWRAPLPCLRTDTTTSPSADGSTN